MLNSPNQITYLLNSQWLGHFLQNPIILCNWTDEKHEKLEAQDKLYLFGQLKERKERK